MQKSSPTQKRFDKLLFFFGGGAAGGGEWGGGGYGEGHFFIAKILNLHTAQGEVNLKLL